MKNSVDYDAKNCNCQYNSENHLVSIKYFHKKSRPIRIIVTIQGVVVSP